MTDSNATELLRKLLDGRGVEYDTRDGKAVKNTYWNVGDLRFGYCEQIYEDGQHETDLFMYRGYGCTPEQAADTIESLRDRLQNLAFERGMSDAFEAKRRGEYEDTRWYELFGTPERAARIIADNCPGGSCIGCPAINATECGVGDYDALLEWLRGKAAS